MRGKLTDKMKSLVLECTALDIEIQMHSNGANIHRAAGIRSRLIGYAQWLNEGDAAEETLAKAGAAIADARAFLKSCFKPL